MSVSRRPHLEAAMGRLRVRLGEGFHRRRRPRRQLGQGEGLGSCDPLGSYVQVLAQARERRGRLSPPR
jgi:hypothetical protein